MKRVAALVAVLALAGVVTWLVWPSAPEARGLDQRISVVDGPADDQRVELDATFFPAAGGGKAPAVLLAHGFGGSKQSVRQQAVRLAQDGYAVLTWSARGFGRSTGEIALNSADYEVKDVKQLIDWLAKRPEVRLDAAGDPRVGIAGGSYGGAITLMTAAYDTRVDAIVPQITWADLADALFPDGGGQGPANGVFKRMWAGYFFGRGAPVQGGGAAQGLGALTQQSVPLTAEQARCGRFLPAVCEMYQQVAKTGRATPEAIELLRKSSPVAVASRIKAPTLLIQGQRDSLFPLGQADANAKAIASAGTPVSLAWFDGGHDGGNGEVDWLYDQTAGWFGHYLKGDGSPLPQKFTVTRDGGRDPGTRQRIRLHPESGSYPGLGGTTTTAITLTGPEQNIANPPGGSPASISTVPGVAGLLGGGGTTNLSVGLDMPGQVATFESAPLTAPLQLTGSPSVKLKVYGKGQVTLFAKLYDVADNAQPPNLPAGLVSPLRVTIPDGAESVETTVTLPAVDFRFAVGHRLRLAVTTTDMGYATPAEPASYRIGLAAPTLAVPTVAALAAPATGVAWWVWAMPLAAIALAALILATGRTPSRRRPTFLRKATGQDTSRLATVELDDSRADTLVSDNGQSASVQKDRNNSGTSVTDGDPLAADPSPGEAVPLEISGLTKAYRNGELAVDDLSFRVERGQVLGLLGPNGAGKTTTMRMMMGLIQPDAGEVRIFGDRVTPGAPVLSRLGSFVEGPGFLPHLSGRDNIELYWAATGRPAADARFDDALEIADLGKALDRAVRTYSQGMRQRLAIAQAMLGLPDLLVLDEPTNGLDPPQIREMREVLKRYARDGRTVIVSSHLLAEVEQTCSHAVVMHRGRLVSAGPVSVLLSAAVSTNGHGPRLEDVFLDLIGQKS
ncbi:CocE/NonD family hydrolase [Nonomuraea guangzhouensis]|uniref:CocE/NonD family hydrolase n=1 Tax=Nonomuraea guangzhouensis TaxID=1291555 RepID=A0ABW4G5M8_9ACTN|nr:CocE/NonD family hydrolase [Nonomuraea guangzhouensis]